MFGALKEKEVLKLGWRSWNKKSSDTRRWQNARWTSSIGKSRTHRQAQEGDCRALG
jgi:hypothetical protein